MRIIASEAHLGKCAVKKCDRNASYIVQRPDDHSAVCPVHAKRLGDYHGIVAENEPEKKGGKRGKEKRA